MALHDFYALDLTGSNYYKNNGYIMTNSSNYSHVSNLMRLLKELLKFVCFHLYKFNKTKRFSRDQIKVLF